LLALLSLGLAVVVLRRHGAARGRIEA